MLSERYFISFSIGAAIFLGVGFWLFVEFISRNSGFLSKPVSEQRNIKRKLYRGMYGGLAIGLLLISLVQNDITFWLPYLELLFYLLIWFGGIYFIWLAYQFGIRRNTDRIKKRNGEPFNHPKDILNSFALVNLLSGCAVLLIALMIPLLKIDIKSWGALLAGVLVIRNLAIGFFEKSDITSGN